MEIMGSKILSPFTLKHDPQYWSKVLPPPLQPTALQANLPHHPYVDVLACAKMRDVILQFGAAIDAHELCADLMGNGLDGHSGIIVWGDPWVPESVCIAYDDGCDLTNGGVLVGGHRGVC